MKNKFQDFKEIEDNTDLNEKYNTEEYKKKAGEIYKEWLNKWKRLKEKHKQLKELLLFYL
nr:hypothetical protein [Mycoplasmopsis bovis]